MRRLPFFQVMKRKPGTAADRQAAGPVSWAPKTRIGMVSPAEMEFYYESAARYIGKKGAIVDLGCWLGATSVALAQGILSSTSTHDPQGEKVFGFDLFRWEDWMPAGITYSQYLPGESFLPEARRVVSDHGGGRVELVQTDLRSYLWSGEPIKILLVDAMKTLELATQIARTFFPSLTEGSLLIHQDFKHYFTSWIHLIHYRLRDHFRFYRSVPFGTVAFEIVSPLSREAVNQATELAAISDEEVDSAFRYSLELVKAEERTDIAAAHVMYYVHAKRKDVAWRIAESYRPAGMLDQREFPRALSYLRQLG